MSGLDSKALLVLPPISIYWAHTIATYNDTVPCDTNEVILLWSHIDSGKEHPELIPGLPTFLTSLGNIQR